MMFIAIGLLILAVVLALSIGWIWLCLGVRRHGWRGLAGAVALQLSLVVLVFGVMNGQGLGAILDALLPPLFLGSTGYYEQFSAFISGILPYAIPAGVMTALPFMAFPNARRWCVAPAMLVALATGIVMGEGISQQAMCREAAALGISSFPRNSLLWSLANTPEEFQSEIHATFKKDGKRFGWSYREMGWYEIPRDAWGDVYGPAFQCPTG